MRSLAFVALWLIGIRSAAAVDLESMYQVCASCHAIGVANAPKVGDARSWRERLKKSPEALIDSVRNGVPGTLMEGGICRDCSDRDILALGNAEKCHPWHFSARSGAVHARAGLQESCPGQEAPNKSALPLIERMSGIAVATK